MNRLIVLLGLLVSVSAASAQNARPTTAQPIGRLTHLIASHPDGNILVIETEHSVVLVDALGAGRAALADSALRTVTHKPVKTVISTHYHEDHTGGNAIWAARGARLIGHRNVPLEASKDTTIVELKWHRIPVPKEAIPFTLFDDSLRIEVDSEPIHVMHLVAHTAGDAAVWLPQRNILHTGDIVEIGAPPQIDWWAGGTLEGMISAVNLFLELTNDSTVIVPGHGPPINRPMLRSYRMLLVAAGMACDAPKPGVRNFACKPDKPATPTSH
jgi:glyoxylase-like metal-dependent hydrolase (beta-lactamase superfamily II)